MKPGNRATAQRLMQAFMQFKKVDWHQRSNAGRKPSEIMVLNCLRKGGANNSPGMKVLEISRRLHVTSPTVTQLINDLEKDGLVERSMDPQDRRAVRVKLTEAGDKTANRAIENFIASFGGLAEYLGEERSDQLVGLLNDVFVYFQEKQTSWESETHTESDDNP